MCYTLAMASRKVLIAGVTLLVTITLTMILFILLTPFIVRTAVQAGAMRLSPLQLINVEHPSPFCKFIQVTSCNNEYVYAAEGDKTKIIEETAKNLNATTKYYIQVSSETSAILIQTDSVNNRGFIVSFETSEARDYAYKPVYASPCRPETKPERCIVARVHSTNVYK